MNPEIKTIVENMRRGKKDALNTSDILVYQFGQMAHLLSLLAEESEKSAEKTEKLTRRILCLTWAIAILTAVLLFTSFFEFPKVSISKNKPVNQLSHYTEQNQTNNLDENHK